MAVLCLGTPRKKIAINAKQKILQKIKNFFELFLKLVSSIGLIHKVARGSHIYQTWGLHRTHRRTILLPTYQERDFPLIA